MELCQKRGDLKQAALFEKKMLIAVFCQKYYSGFGAKINYPTFAMINGAILYQDFKKRDCTEDGVMMEFILM